MTGTAGDLDGVDAVLFDLGRVLVDIDVERCCAHWAAAAELDAREVRARLAADPHFEARFEAHERGELACEDFLAGLAERLALPLDVDAMRAGWNAIFGAPDPRLPPRLVALAARFPLHVFSNTNAAHTAVWRRDQHAVLAPMTSVHVSHELGRRKPGADAFAAVAARLGLAPDRIRFVDDAPANVDGARRAGLRATRIDGLDATVAWLDAVLARPVG